MICIHNIHMHELVLILYYCFYVFIRNHLRLDKGTETGSMAAIHAFVRQYGSEEDKNAAEETLHYGPSTSNKVRTVLDTSMEILVV